MGGGGRGFMYLNCIVVFVVDWEISGASCNNCDTLVYLRFDKREFIMWEFHGC